MTMKKQKKLKKSEPLMLTNAPSVFQEFLSSTTTITSNIGLVTTVTTGKSKRKSKKKAAVKGPNIVHFLKNKLRRASYMWPPMKEVMTKARVERGKYECAKCKGIFGPKEVQRDHIIPVDDPHTGFVDWNTYVERLFCGVEGLQCLCKPCHDTKSQMENVVRRDVKREKTKVEGDDI